MNTSIDYRKVYNALTHFLAKNQIAVIALITVALVAVVVVQMNALLDADVDQLRLNDKLNELQIVEFDTAAIEEIRQLIDSEVEINPRFLDTRTNPFGE